MDVYIEVVIIDNFSITFLLSKLSYYMLGEAGKLWRILAASFIGTVVAVFYPFIRGIWSVLAKIICGLIMCFLLFKPKKLLRGSVIFFLLTFVFGGALFAVGYFIHGSVEKALTRPLVGIPIGVILLCAYLIFVVIKSIVKKMRKSRDVKNFLYDAEIEMFGTSVKCKAFLDSGNRLYDNGSGMPIVIASVSTLSQALSDELMTSLVIGKIKDFKNAHYVDYSTVGGKSKMFVFQPDGLVVYNGDKKNIINDVMLGVVFKRISDAESYGLILNPAVMTGEGIC